MHRTYQTTDVMAEHLAERFVNLCAAGLTSKRISELRLNHHKRTLYIRALVVILHEPISIVLIEAFSLAQKSSICPLPCIAILDPLCLWE